MKKKIAVSIEKGYKIGQENNITKRTGRFFRLKDGKIREACALGFSLIGAFGLEKATEMAVKTKKQHCGDDYGKVENLLNVDKEPNTCLKLKTNNDAEDVTTVIYDLNDAKEKTIPEIVEILSHVAIDFLSHSDIISYMRFTCLMFVIAILFIITTFIVGTGAGILLGHVLRKLTE